MNDNKKKKNSYRLDIVLIVSFFVMLISFCAYMMNTTLEEVLENETGSSVVTHDYTYESAESSSAAQCKIQKHDKLKCFTHLLNSPIYDISEVWSDT